MEPCGPKQIDKNQRVSWLILEVNSTRKFSSFNINHFHDGEKTLKQEAT